MAKTVYTPEEIELQDGTPIVLKPLPIALLKKAMKFMEQSDEITTEEDSYEFILGLAQLCIEKQLPPPGQDSEGNMVEYKLEETLDLVTGKRIIAVCTGVDFDNPNLAALAMEQAQNGQS